MALKTNYKDDLYDGQRRYNQIKNEDGTVSMVDATNYTQKGDKFGANDINETNFAVNRLEHVTPVTLTAAGWTGSAAPFTQTVAVSGAMEGQEPTVVSALTDGADAATQKAYSKAYGIICSGTAELTDGQAIFRVYKKPATDIVIGLRGV